MLAYTVLATALAVAGADHQRADHVRDAPTTLRVAAASDLAAAMAELDATFEKHSGVKIELSLGSTGLFARQIAEGAPFDVFAAASAAYVDDVVKAGACDASTRSIYGRGRIVLWSSKSVGLGAPTLAALTGPSVKKIAIANPEHAPYGVAAKDALVHAGIWDKVSSKIVYGENIQQTLQLARSGNVEVAVVALSLAIAPATSAIGTYTPVDDALYAPIEQALVVCRTNSAGGKDVARVAAAKRFAAFVTSTQGRAILSRYGFSPP